ncbi:MAG: hypothetical protein HC870_00920 [Rhizobiales bacterium]|nr:hypothetical protein [Hyphomicrobiales bacterium]
MRVLGMNRALALALPISTAIRIDTFDLARRLIVLGCAAALILAGQTLPY